MDDLFPFPENVGLSPPELRHDYDTFAVSAFDHCLREEEYETKMITFSTFRKVPSRQCELWDTYEFYENRFRIFYDNLYKRGVCMVFKDKYAVTFDGIQEYRRYYMYDVREMNRWHTYAVPSLGIMVSGNFDLTHIAHASKSHYKKEEFEKIVSDAGLYILS